jgi:hypothetical protein
LIFCEFQPRPYCDGAKTSGKAGLETQLMPGLHGKQMGA